MLTEISPSDLRNSAVSQWRSRLVGGGSQKAIHWQTKVSYYSAVVDLIQTRGSAEFSWRDVVKHVRPRGSRTTFYEVAGLHAKHSLFSLLAVNGDPQVMQLALCYRRGDAIGRLIDEAKVWSFWTYRESLRDRFGTGHDATALREVLHDWARDHPSLAAALDCAPPACAVEDLAAIRPAVMAAGRAYTLLAADIGNALGARVATRT